MTAFDLLHPALQHHLVNSLGWRLLRPLQEAAIEPLVAGHHALLIAPTAGGKTEAGFFPILSRMATERWQGLSVLYVCPIRALLNNLEPRLQGYAGFVGRRVARWHGDIRHPERRRILADPVDVLLTTPESIEVILDSRSIDRGGLLGGLRAVIIDELHAFAGDDRGWHLLAVLERACRMAGRELQRVGLSATVGNPAELLAWMAGHCEGARTVIAPPQSAQAAPKVVLDHVGSIENAATVIARLHRGEKRLVFCDSRARVESLAARLRAQGVATFVSHSSLSAEQRREAERAFAEGDNCVIVATSTLELGLDVGDLDRIIQIDAPYTVASFLQRMGRTGRRSGTSRNCLLLATEDDSLLRAAALLCLWGEGFVEPVVAPPAPLHLFAQQVMGLVLQEGSLERRAWRDWIGRLPKVAHVGAEDLDGMIDHMLEQEILFEDQGLISFGVEGERAFGWRNFVELFSIFVSPPMFQVLHGRSEVGYVHQTSFQVRAQATPVLLLGGRSWSVRHIDWSRHIAYVEPSTEHGRSRWIGESPPLHFQLCQMVRRVLLGMAPPGQLSKRATERLAAVRAEMPWLEHEGTVIVRDAHGKVRWWTFAGTLANVALAAGLGPGRSHRADNFAIELDETWGTGKLKEWLQGQEMGEGALPIDTDAVEGLKFHQCLPARLVEGVLRRRLFNRVAIEAVLAGLPREVTLT